MLYVQTVHGGASGLWGLAGQGKVPGDRSAEGREIVGMVCAVMNFFFLPCRVVARSVLWN